jgi:hypothetical protein
MDPVGLILTALVSGASAAAKDTASEAIKDAYHGLKAVIQRKFAGKPEAEVALATYAKKPESWKAPLEDALMEVDAGKDEQILEKARGVMQLVDPQGTAEGKYAGVHFYGNVQGAIVGDDAEQKNYFGVTPKQE